MGRCPSYGHRMAWQDVLLPQMTFTWLGRCFSRIHPKAWEDVNVIDPTTKGCPILETRRNFLWFYEIPAWLSRSTLSTALPWIFGNLRCAIKLAKVKFNSAADWAIFPRYQLEPSYFCENVTLQFLYFIAFIIDNICVSQNLSVQCMYTMCSTVYWILSYFSQLTLIKGTVAWDGFFAHCILSRIERKDPKFFSCYANISLVRARFNSFSA